MDTSSAIAFSNAAAQIANVGANAMAAANSRKDAAAARQLSIDVMHEQRQWALDDWNRVNEYNHPLQQMQRLKEAGLNPNLVYGSGSGASGMSNSVPTQGTYSQVTPYQYPQNIFAGLSSIAEGFIMAANLRKTEAETSSIEEHTALTSQQKLSEMIRRDGMSYANAKTREEANIWRQKLKMDLDLNQEAIDKMASEIGLNTTKRAGLKLHNRLDFYYSGRERESDLLSKEFQRLYVRQQIGESVSRMNLNYKTSQKVEHEIYNLAQDFLIKGREISMRDLELEVSRKFKHLGITGGSDLANLARLLYSLLRNPEKIFTR